MNNFVYRVNHHTVDSLAFSTAQGFILWLLYPFFGQLDPWESPYLNGPGAIFWVALTLAQKPVHSVSYCSNFVTTNILILNVNTAKKQLFGTGNYRVFRDRGALVFTSLSGESLLIRINVSNECRKVNLLIQPFLLRCIIVSKSVRKNGIRLQQLSHRRHDLIRTIPYNA